MKDAQQWLGREIQSKADQENTLHIWCRSIFDEWKNWIKTATRRDPSHKTGVQMAGWTNTQEDQQGRGGSGPGWGWDESRTQPWEPCPGRGSWTLLLGQRRSTGEMLEAAGRVKPKPLFPKHMARLMGGKPRGWNFDSSWELHRLILSSFESHYQY